MLFAAAGKLNIEYHVIDLFSGEQCQPAFTGVNPNQAVPFLEDNDFRLAESSTTPACIATWVTASSIRRCSTATATPTAAFNRRAWRKRGKEPENGSRFSTSISSARRIPTSAARG